MAEPLSADNMGNVAGYILKGLNEKEACTMADVSYTDFLKKKEQVESIRVFFEKKEIEFKLVHIEQIQKTASEKNSMYLLEKLRPEEFGNKKSGGEVPVNIISLIVKSIQNDNNQPLIVKNRSAKIQLENDREPVLEISSVLGGRSS